MSKPTQVEPNTRLYEYNCHECAMPVAFIYNTFGEPYIEKIYCWRCGQRKKDSARVV